jgi:hypothetical protein
MLETQKLREFCKAINMLKVIFLESVNNSREFRKAFNTLNNFNTRNQELADRPS